MTAPPDFYVSSLRGHPCAGADPSASEPLTARAKYFASLEQAQAWADAYERNWSVLGWRFGPISLSDTARFLCGDVRCQGYLGILRPVLVGCLVCDNEHFDWGMRLPRSFAFDTRRGVYHESKRVQNGIASGRRPAPEHLAWGVFVDGRLTREVKPFPVAINEAGVSIECPICAKVSRVRAPQRAAPDAPLHSRALCRSNGGGEAAG